MQENKARDLPAAGQERGDHLELAGDYPLGGHLHAARTAEDFEALWRAALSARKDAKEARAPRMDV